MANEDHLAQLLKGPLRWNEWREANDHIRPDLSGADLRGRQLNLANLVNTDLSNADLSGADLGYTFLQGAKFEAANLGGASLWKANLFEADLSEAHLVRANLSYANLLTATLSNADLRDADLRGANLTMAQMARANLGGATIVDANLQRANLIEANLSDADLERTNLGGANLIEANLVGARLPGANLSTANLSHADLSRVDLSNALLSSASFVSAKLIEARLIGATLIGASLLWADLTRADLRGADLQAVTMVETNFTSANLTGCRVYGTSAWKVILENSAQENLVITHASEPDITVDNIEVAQFVHLLLHNEKVRNVIDTVGKKGVLLLGRFTDGRIEVLNRLRDKLRSLGFVPMVFNFDKPETKDFTETVRLLANLSHFVIVDITNPRSTPLELQAAVPDYMVPFVPILEKGQEPFAMFVDLQNRYDWVLDPVISYRSVDRLIEAVEDKIVKPAEAKFNELLARRTKQLRVDEI